MALTIPIELQKSSPPSRQESVPAWYIPGGDISSWVAEVATLSSELQKVPRFFIIPTSASNWLPSGCVIWFCGKSIASSKFQRGFGLQLIHEKLLIPSDCRLSLAVSAGEIADLVPSYLAMMLPGDRCYSFDEAEAKSLQQFVPPFEVKPTAWNEAVFPENSTPELKSIQVHRLPDPEESIEQWRDDIGQENPDGLPDLPDGSDAKEARSKGMRESFYESILNFTEKVPRSDAVKETWINKLENWASDKLGGMGSRQQDELNRLIDLMKRDPDKGLKFALPLSNQDGGRGSAPPGGGLGRRNVNFNLGKLFGSGQSISPWMVDDHYYQELLKSYREAANRELNLGRHRRAAYIFAELLSDMPSAANALEQGKHYSEAAVLYEKKINDKYKAALTYKKAGMFSESLRLYRELEDHKGMAGLLRELGREEEAVDAYNTAVAQLLLKNQYVEAAGVAKNDLADVSQARLIYQNGWPNSTQAAECLKLEFSLLQENDQHNLVEERIRELTSAGAASEMATQILVRQLVETSQIYPQQDIAALASDSARVVTGNHLSRKGSQKAAVLQALPNLDVGDRLLSRDAKRFGKKKAGIRPPVPINPTPVNTDHSLTLVAKYHRSPHPPESKPTAACGVAGQTVVASLIGRDQLYIVRSNYELGLAAKVQVTLPKGVSPDFRLLSISNREESGVRSVLVKDGYGTEFPFEPLGSDFEVGISKDLSDTVGVVSDESGQVWCIKKLETGEVFLQGSHFGSINSTVHLTTLPAEWVETIPHMPCVCWRDQIYFAMGTRLCRFSRGELSVVDLPSPILQMVATPDRTRGRIAIAMERGFAVVWSDINYQNPEVIKHKTFDEDFVKPQVGFLKSLHLVVAGETCMGIFTVDKDSVKRNGGYAMPSSSESILAVVPKQSTYSFEVVTSKEIMGMTASKLRQ